MKPHSRIATMLVFVIAFYTIMSVAAFAQTGSEPTLVFREGWNGDVLGVRPVTQDTFDNSDLIAQLYGLGTYAPGRDFGPFTSETTVNVNVRQFDDEASSIVWSGMAEGSWAVTMKHRDSFIDLSPPGSKIRWRTFQEGISQVLRPVLKLADGTYILGLEGSGPTSDYEVTEFDLADMNWIGFDPVRVIDTQEVIDPDLSRVDEIGFTTLSRGGGHGAGVAAHVDWFEVYGVSVPRSRRATSR